MKEYYSKRAKEFEESYYKADQERQAELQDITSRIQELFHGRSILEIACGTGYWTERVGAVANSITGIDITEETLEIARSKGIKNAEFIIGNAYELEGISGDFNGGIANFWLSHVPVENVRAFLDILHNRLGSGAIVFMADNMYVPGVGGELIHKFGDNNTYKLRELNDGTTYEILKNYYTEVQLKGIFEPLVNELNIYIGSSFWRLSYRVR